jgi:hypothetical protein
MKNRANILYPNFKTFFLNRSTKFKPKIKEDSAFSDLHDGIDQSKQRDLLERLEPRQHPTCLHRQTTVKVPRIPATRRFEQHEPAL